MAQISIIEKNDINKAHRIDAEYFKPFNLKSEKLITSKPFFKLKDIGKFVIGPFGSTVKAEDYVSTKEYKYIRGKDIKNGVLINDDNVAVSEEKYNSLPKYHLQNQDLLITVVGTLGNVAIYRDSFGPAIFSCKSTILRPEKINSELLMIFLSTKYGKSLLMRNERGAIQKGFNLPDLKNIPIPVFSENFEKEILNDVKKSHQKQSQSKELYKEVEQILLKELNLLGYKSKHSLTFETTSREVGKATRFDAEYFQPKYAEIIEHIEKYSGGFDTVQNVLNFNNKTFTPKGNQYYQYIPLSRVSKIGEIEIPEKELGIDLPTRARRLVKAGEFVLSSISGSLETSAIIEKEHNNFLVSNGFYVFSSDVINPETLLILFKSKIMIELLTRISKGAILGGYDLTAFKKIKIPVIQKQVQLRIAEKLQDSNRLRKESKELLETAKRKVEEEIEKK